MLKTFLRSKAHRAPMASADRDFERAIPIGRSTEKRVLPIRPA